MFEYFDTERNKDYLTVTDRNGKQLQRLSGNNEIKTNNIQIYPTLKENTTKSNTNTE